MLFRSVSQSRYTSNLERENKNIQKLAAEKEKKESELKQLKELQEQNKEKLKEAMAKYEATKEVISEQLRKEYEKEIAGYEEAKAKHNELIKGKDKEISQIKGELESAKLNLPIYYRNKIFTEEEREKLFLDKIEKGIVYVLGIKIDLKTEESRYRVQNAMNKSE